MNDENHPGLYVHCPFCLSKCPYCGFYSITDLSFAELWLNAINNEMMFYRDCFSRFDSIYLGGGTPTVLKESVTGRLIESLYKNFSFYPDAEFTIEANPDDLTEDRLRFLKSIGVNRLSVGVQSFNEKELRFLKRRHTADGAVKALWHAKSVGFKNLSIDLMYGFTGHSEESWLKTLKRALEFEPSHLSCYQMTYEDKTHFGRMKTKGELKPLTETQERRFFLLTSRFLKEKGFIHYEVSNFARERGFLSRHNLKYWRHIPYLGLGPSAHSFKGGVRWWNHRSVKQYCKNIRAGKKPVEDSEVLTPEQLRFERLYLGFRTEEGVAIEDALYDNQSFEILGGLKRSKFVIVRNNRIIPTERGLLIADRLPLIFWQSI